MEPIISLINRIPSAFWIAVLAPLGALIGSLVALGGVLIANRDNTNRLRIQLAHDADQKATERVATMRREAYMKAAEEMVRATHHLGNLHMIDVTKVSLADGLQDFFRAAAKMELVAESNTGLLVNRLVSTYGEVMVRLTPLAKPIHGHKIEIEIFDDLYKTAHSEVKRVLSEQTKFVETAQNNNVVYVSLQRSLAGFREQAKSFADQRDEAWEHLNAALIPFNKQLLIEMRKIASLQIEALVEIRRDLGLTTDLDAYRREMERQWNSAELNVENALRDLNAA